MPSFVRTENETHYREVTGGERRRLNYFLAKRYFGMSPPEWDASPWWYTELLIDGLMQEGILKDPNATEDPQVPTGTTGKPARSVDLSAPGPLPSGFQTRRVG